jgi:hypothetical protein
MKIEAVQENLKMYPVYATKLFFTLLLRRSTNTVSFRAPDRAEYTEYYYLGGACDVLFRAAGVVSFEETKQTFV